MPFPRSRPATLLLLVAAASAWLCISLPVFAQEAYYWTYAQHPDLSYFDHPPMVAWLIWLGTSVFGDGAVGIRFGTWVCGLTATWVGWRLLKDFGIDETGQAAWILFGIASPILAMTHALANPDPPLVCGWTVAMYAMWKARNGGLSWWILAGVAAGVALLSKYSAGFLMISGIVLLAADAPLRRQLARPGPYLGVLVAAIVFSPVVIWNARYDFESFRFQTSNRLSRAELGFRWFFELVSGQVVVLHPALMLLLPFAVLWLVRRWRHDARALWLLAFGLPLPLYMLVNSLWIQVKVNWLAPAYVPLLLGLVVAWREGTLQVRHPRLVSFAAASLWLTLLAIPLAPLLRLVPAGKGSSWSGWEEIAARAEQWEDTIDPVDGIEGNVFFFAADYRDAAQLGRSLKMMWAGEVDHEVIAGWEDSGEATMAQNVISKPALQYDHWTRPENRVGQDAIFVLPRPAERQEMVEAVARHFTGIEKVERVDVHRLGILVMEADIYICRGYCGPQKRE